MKILVDTNAYAAFMRGHAGVVSRVRRAERVLVSTVVVGELLFGFSHGSREARNRRDLERFLDNPFVELVPVTYPTAERFARIAAALRRKGRPVPTNDIWIAAHALETGADLLSFDRHFGEADGLVWIRPDEDVADAT